MQSRFEPSNHNDFRDENLTPNPTVRIIRSPEISCVPTKEKISSSESEGPARLRSILIGPSLYQQRGKIFFSQRRIF